MWRYDRIQTAQEISNQKSWNHHWHWCTKKTPPVCPEDGTRRQPPMDKTEDTVLRLRKKGLGEWRSTLGIKGSCPQKALQWPFNVAFPLPHLSLVNPHCPCRPCIQLGAMVTHAFGIRLGYWWQWMSCLLCFMHPLASSLHPLAVEQGSGPIADLTTLIPRRESHHG